MLPDRTNFVAYKPAFTGPFTPTHVRVDHKVEASLMFLTAELAVYRARFFDEGSKKWYLKTTACSRKRWEKVFMPAKSQAPRRKT